MILPTESQEMMTTQLSDQLPSLPSSTSKELVSTVVPLVTDSAASVPVTELSQEDTTTAPSEGIGLILGLRPGNERWH